MRDEEAVCVRRRLFLSARPLKPSRVAADFAAADNNGSKHQGRYAECCRCSSAERLAPANSSNPERNAQNIMVTESANGPYTS
jgi:hypothetical protein